MSAKKIKAILSEVLSRITPPEDEVEVTREQTGKVLAKLNKALKGIKAKATVQGSFQKNTQLRHTFDIDVFVHFDYKTYSGKDKVISDLLEGKLKKIFKNIERLHGSRDYFQVAIKPYSFEIVPILHVTSSKQARNITDVSPLHAAWVAKKLKRRMGEIRLAKAFLRGQDIYGAESYVRGFSGYAAEVLTIYYGSFLKLLRAASKWKAKVIIDPEKAYKRANPLLKLNNTKTASPLIVIDPVQPERNVTAALSEESFSTFVKAASRFLSNPSKSFFIRKITSKEDLKRQKNPAATLLILEIAPEEGKRDVIGAAMMTKYEATRKALLENSFKVMKSSWMWEKDDNAILWFFISKKLPEEYEERRGPQASNEIHAARFRSMHKNAYERKGRFYAKVRRKFATPKELVAHMLKQESFREKAVRARAEWH